MTDHDRPNQAANKEKAEPRPEDRGRGEATPPPNGDAGGGISNRSLDEELRNQERVPNRGEAEGDIEGASER